MITSNLNTLLSYSLDKNYDMKPINIKQTKLLMKTDYSEAAKSAKKGICIYRGQRDGYINSPFISTPNYRISQNANYNIYTRLLSDILPSWKEYPKRNHSFICTNNINRADDYGNIYIVLPKNGTKLGICPEEDIWDSFQTLPYTLNDFNIELSAFLLWILNTDNSDNTYNKINMAKLFENGTTDEIENLFYNADKKMINFLSANDYEIYYPEMVHNDLAEKILSNYKDELITGTLNDMLNPETNHFNLIDIKNYSSFFADNNEIWFDNEAIFIPYSLQRILV